MASLVLGPGPVVMSMRDDDFDRMPSSTSCMVQSIRYHAKKCAAQRPGTTTAGRPMSSSPQPPRRFLLYGETGVGKTHFIDRHVLKKHSPIIQNIGLVSRLRGTDLFKKNIGEGEGVLLEAFEGVRNADGGSGRLHFIIFEGMGSMYGASYETLERNGKIVAGFSVRRFTALLVQLLVRLPENVCFIGTVTTASGATTRDDALKQMDLSLFGYECIEQAVAIMPPSKTERASILRLILGRSRDRETGGAESTPLPLDDEWVDSVAADTSSYTPADLEQLYREAALQALRRSKTVGERGFAKQTVRPGVGDFMEALRNRSQQPSIYRSGGASYVRSMPKDMPPLSKVVGADDAKKTLHAHVVLPLQFPGRFLDLGVRPPSGLLLHGKEGDGKSYLAMATGKELEVSKIASVISVSCTALLSKVVGESEEKIANVFSQARRTAPCLLILDEIQTIAPKRGNDTTNENTFDRLLSCLLVEMDGIGNKGDDRNVFVLGITRDLERVDEALLRPGRLDCTMEVQPPTESERLDLQAFFSKRSRGGQSVKGIDEGNAPGIMYSRETVTRANIMHWHQEKCLAVMRKRLSKINLLLKT